MNDYYKKYIKYKYKYINLQKKYCKIIKIQSPSFEFIGVGTKYYELSNKNINIGDIIIFQHLHNNNKIFVYVTNIKKYDYITDIVLHSKIFNPLLPQANNGLKYFNPLLPQANNNNEIIEFYNKKLNKNKKITKIKFYVIKRFITY